MESTLTPEEIKEKVDGLNFAQKVERSLGLISEANAQFGHRIVVANSLGKDSVVVWHLAQRVNPKFRGFIVTTRYKPRETVQFMGEEVARHPELRVFRNDATQPDKLYLTDPDQCCYNLKVEPTRQAIQEMDVDCWVTGLRCTEGRTRTDYEEIENKGGLIKINPILTFEEAEVWRYMSTHKIEPHPWYALGYRSLGCAPCSNPGGVLERDGRWQDTSKCGGECGIHTMALK